MRKIYLASTSPWRLQLLRATGLQVEAIRSEVDEESIHGVNPPQTALLRARAKALVGRKNTATSDIVIAADQVVYVDDQLYGKPRDTTEWLERLQRMRGREHHLTTAVCIYGDDVQEEIVETTNIRFRKDLDDNDLLAYIQHGEAANCAGGYMIENVGAWLIDSVDGDWQNIIGLPIIPVLSCLRKLGFSLQQVVEG